MSTTKKTKSKGNENDNAQDRNSWRSSFFIRRRLRLQRPRRQWHFSSASYAAPEGNGNFSSASYVAPEGNGNFSSASHAAPEGNGHVDIG